MTKTGLVFSGGGGKGAYAVGVWKALREFGLDQNISAVAGTSVGGLNGALFVQGDIKRAEQLWLDIATDKILQLDIKLLAEKIAKVAAQFSIPGFQGKALLQLAQSLKGNGWFSQKGLHQLIQESGACSIIPESTMPFYVCALNQHTGKLTYPQLNTIDEATIAQWLLASAAIPGVFSPVLIDDAPYWDGGVLPGMFADNTPFKPLIEEQSCTHIINVYLSRSPAVAQEQAKYPDTKLWNIIPSEAFEGLIPALNFTPENARKLMELGYSDVSRMLKQFKAFADDEARYLDAICDFQQSDKHFESQIELNQSLRYTGSDLASEAVSEQQKEVAPVSSKKINYKEVMDQLAVSITQQEQSLINNGLDTLIDEMKDNSEELLEEAFTAITTLASTEGRINDQLQQGVIGRLLGTITGSNVQQQAEINKDFHSSLYATQQLVQKLNHKQMLTMDAMVTLSNKSNYLMSHINMLYGAVKSQEQQQLDNFRLFSTGITALAQETEQKLSQLSGRVDRIEHKQALDDWYHEIRHINSDKSDLEKLLQVTAGFYEASGRSWSQPELNRYKSAVQDAGLKAAEFAPAQLFDRRVAHSFVDALPASNILPVAPDKEQFHTLLKGVQISVENNTDQAIQAWQQQLPVPLDTKIPATQLGMELLYSLRRNDRRKPEAIGTKDTKSLPSAQSSLQAQYLNALRQLTALAYEIPLSQSYKDSLSYLINKIENFKVVVPVIGKFSAGKSALLNRYLGRDFLASDITPETALATEITYSEQEYIVLNYQDNHTVQKPLSALQNLEIDEQLAFVQVFVNNIRLKHRPDLVLVDMPGFDSRNQSHHKAIAWYLNRGDYFINLMPSDVPFDASVMEHLAEVKYDYNKDIGCLISKAARRSPTQLMELRQQLKISLFDYLQVDIEPGEIEALDKQGSIKDFEHQLDRAVRNYDSLLNQRYQADLTAIIKQAEQSVTAALQNLNGGEAEIQQKIEEASNAFKRIEQQLNGNLAELKYNLCSAGKEQLISEATSVLNASTEQLVIAAKNNALSQEINALLRPVMQSGVHQLIEAEVSRLQSKMDIIPQTEGNISVTIQLPPEEKERFSAKYAAIGAGIAILFTGPLGAAITGIMGGLFGRKDNAEEREQLIRNAVTQKVIPEAVHKVADHIETRLHESVTSLSQSVHTMLEQESSTYQSNLEQLRNSLQQAQNNTQEQQAQYEQWQTELAGLTDTIHSTIIA